MLNVALMTHFSKLSWQCQAALWHMPLAVGVALYDGNGDYTRMILEYRDVLFVFWEPSVELRAVSPVFVRFPAHDSAQWSQGIMATTREGEYPRQMVSYELANLAPDARVLMQRMKISLADMNQMIIWSYENNTVSQCFSCAAWFGGCTWLQQNMDTWRSWIPKSDACFAGQGMYSATRMVELEAIDSHCFRVASHAFRHVSPVSHLDIPIGRVFPSHHWCHFMSFYVIFMLFLCHFDFWLTWRFSVGPRLPSLPLCRIEVIEARKWSVEPVQQDATLPWSLTSQETPRSVVAWLQDAAGVNEIPCVPTCLATDQPWESYKVAAF